MSEGSVLCIRTLPCIAAYSHKVSFFFSVSLFKIFCFYLYFVEVQQDESAFAYVWRALHPLEVADFVYICTETSDK